jgi:hypothetical protein
MSRSKRAAGVVAVVMLAGIAPVAASSGAAAATPSPAVSSCPSSASWALDVDVLDLGHLLTAPATIVMADGTSQPVGIVTAPSSSTLTGSIDLSWSPDGTALAFGQISGKTGYDVSYTPLVADWDGTHPVPLPGREVLWSPTSDRLLASGLLDGTPDTSQIGRRTASGWDFVTGPIVEAPRWNVAWSSDGTKLAWVDPAGAVWVGDADGHDAQLIGDAPSEESPLQFKPDTHLVRVAGPMWFDVDANLIVGPAPRGRLSPNGEWSAWSTSPTWGTSDLLVSHHGGPPVAIATATQFALESLSWSPDSRYLLSDQFEALPTEHRLAPVMYDTMRGTAAVIEPWTSYDVHAEVFVGLAPTVYRWAPASRSFFAVQSTWSIAAGIPPGERVFRYDVDGTRTLVHDWGLDVGGIFWPRSTPVTRLGLTARLDAVGASGAMPLHITVTNDGPCDASDVVIEIRSPAWSPGVTQVRAVQTLALGTIPRGQRAERVVDLVPGRDLPLSVAVSTSTPDDGRSSGPVTLTQADVSALPVTDPAVVAPGLAAMPVAAIPSFTG